MRQGGESRAAACADWRAHSKIRLGTVTPSVRADLDIKTWISKPGYQNLDIKDPCEGRFLRRENPVTI